jgi:hypothetical protein
MSIFASQVTKEVPIPGAEPHTMTVRKLSARQFQEVVALFRADSLIWRDKAIEYGVTAWTLEQPIGVEAFADLVDEVVDAAALEVMKLTKPTWFATKAEAEVELKNDVGVSIVA